MADLLDYAQPPSAGRARAVFGWILFAVCFLLSLHATAMSIDAVWNHFHPEHGGLEAGLIERGIIYLLVPLEGAVAAASWWGCRRLRVGWRLSGAAMAIALIAWICAITSLR